VGEADPRGLLAVEEMEEEKEGRVVIELETTGELEYVEVGGAEAVGDTVALWVEFAAP